jgi:hypothetical protein
MNRNPISEFNHIFDSLLPELKEDMDKIDFRLRTIWSEARTCGVPKKIIESELNRRFWQLAQEVSKGA